MTSFIAEYCSNNGFSLLLTFFHVINQMMFITLALPLYGKILRNSIFIDHRGFKSTTLSPDINTFNICLYDDSVNHIIHTLL